MDKAQTLPLFGTNLPRLMQLQSKLYVTVLERAVKACGSASGVALILNASSTDVEDWLGARRPMPAKAFLTLLDVFFESQSPADLKPTIQLAPRTPTLLPVVRSVAEQSLTEALALHATGMGNVQLLNPRGNLEIVAQRGFDEEFLTFFREVGITDHSVCGRSLACGERVIVEDVQEDGLLAGTNAHAVLLAAGVRSVQSTPVLSGSGMVFGMISTHFAQPGCAHTGLPPLARIARRFADLLETLTPHDGTGALTTR
jgi:hypothetical protein